MYVVFIFMCLLLHYYISPLNLTHNTVLWVITMCSNMVVYKRFRGIWCPHLQGEVNSTMKWGQRYRQGV